ncbi:cysteine desulfurase family protein [Sphingomonas sp.]|uniref:cysteine desulfurase family protein n=1 Tax=Sphingomonas sp. TaxID=28214 RepID=UPI003AFF914C
MAVASRVYLDHAATTPVLPRARAAVMEAMERWANPSSPHAQGRAARAALEEARARIGAALGLPHAILFTGGASEGIAAVFARVVAGGRVVSAAEHDAVTRIAGERAVTCSVDADGLADPEALAAAMASAGPRPLVAIQLVNPQTGVVQDVERIGGTVRAAGGLWLCDATQGAGKMPLPDADFLVLSAHKFGGPPGIGALLVRDLATLAATGGQEQGYRAGTENLPGVAGMAAALDEGRDWLARVAELRGTCDAAIRAAGGEIVAAASPRLPTIASYRMPGVSAAAQLVRLDLAGIAVSAGSACSSGTMKPSPVLAAMGVPHPDEVIRVSFGRTTTDGDVQCFLAAWGAIAADVRARAA